MALQSKLFAGDPKLEAAAISDPAHILPGASGPHVGKIQKAIIRLDDLTIADEELAATQYGFSTADAVLSFKRKRGIINRSYQSTADNIVGKMTIATLDKEIAVAEQVVSNPVIVPLDPLPRPVRPDFLFETQRSTVTARGFVPVAANAGLASFNLFGAPSFPFTQIEIDVDDEATFEVIGGKGERVFVENVRVGLLIDPAEPLRERAVLDVTADRQTFKVKGKGAGTTRLLVTKSGGIFSNAGVVSAALVVNELTVEKLWRPKLEPLRIPPRKRSQFVVEGELGLALATEMFTFDGSVEPRPQIVRADFEIGFVQALTESMMESVYTDNNGGQRRIFESTVERLPVRDSKDAIPWTKPGAFRDLAGGATVHFEDRPQNFAPFQSPDRRVQVKTSGGADKFITFFIARHKRTGAVTVLARVRWEVSWEYDFDFSRQDATPVRRDGSLGDVKLGPGDEQPILGGKTALETLKAGFRP